MAQPENSTLPDWVRDASLGIFIHWGPYSVPAWAEPTGAWGTISPEQWFTHNAYAEWYANTIRVQGSPAAAHHAEVHGGAPYEDFLDEWTALDYDPADWAALFRAMGADYVIPVAKHHDGITLWRAPGTDCNTVTRGPRRDLLAPLAVAVRAEGIRFGVYYSGGLDWSRTRLPPIESMSDVEMLRPVDPDYAAYATAHVRDLIDRYQPSVIWNDIDWPDSGKADGSLAELIAHFRRVVPEGIINDRWGAGIGDYRTSEYAHDRQNEQGVGWEHNRGLGFSFGYNQIEDEILTLGPRELARMYSDVVSRGGRLLLNIGPEASGRIPDVQRRTLTGVAEWLRSVKPLTIGRTSVDPEDISVRGTDWWRAWSIDDRIVVIVADETATVHSPTREIVMIPLPQDSVEAKLS